MSSLWLRKLALAGATLAPSTLAFSHYTAGSAAQRQPTQSSTALRATPLKQCVGGSWVESSSKATIDVEDPTTGALIGKVPEGTAADAHAALVAAKEAQPAWAKTAPAARGEALKAMARVIRANRVELAELLASEQAKVAGLAQVEIDFTAEYFDYYAGWARIYEAGEIISSDVSDPNEHIYLHKIPLGVSVGICPWNFPVFVMARKLAPALVTGNTVVVKSSEVTPLTCARIAELWAASDDAALPPKGTYSVITGLGSTVGAALVSSPLVDIVSMTGSVATGKAIMKSAAEHMTKVSLELGGKAPAIVCADADLDLAVKGIVASRICFSGQVCNCCERVYVHESIKTEFLNKLVAAMESVKVGAPADDGVDICGLVSSMQFDKVKGMVDRAVAGGAKVECGGDTIPAGPKYAYQPTVLTGVKQSDEIVQEETFGPVLPVLTFKTMDEAFDLACDTKFGLTSSIYTTNVDIAERAKNELRFGETYVNRENFEAIQGFHAGMRQSGIGGADGKHGLEEYLASHVVYVRRDPNAGN